MELKPGEIALIVVAIGAPTIFLVLAFIPGGLNFIGDIAMNPVLMPWIFFGGAALLFGTLSYRIYRRMRPLPKKTVEKTVHIPPTKMPKVEGSQALKRRTPPT
jgi:hypothetical protein